MLDYSFPYPLYTEDHHQKFLSPVMYNALVGQAGERNIEDIADGDLRGEVQKVVFRKYWIDNKNFKRCIKFARLEQTNECNVNPVDNSGCFRPILNMQQKDKLIMDIVRFLVLKEPVPSSPEMKKLTAEMMEVVLWISKCQFQAATEDGTRRTLLDIERFLIDLQEDEDGEITLGDVLSFATGADCVPPLGFDPSPSITFLHDSGLFPKANTCSMELKLPVSEDFNTFKKT
ncbi:G2H3 [Mytilus coruscus]|uniref:G2H3 n=1 Tax=Mytilus coruscus TaxID=42192 RepID=A0A6J8DMK9_MYTCO|nr:G2H3 [Mytilus coruscus]